MSQTKDFENNSKVHPNTESFIVDDAFMKIRENLFKAVHWREQKPTKNSTQIENYLWKVKHHQDYALS